MLNYPEIDPVIFSIGFLKVRWYGLMYVIGFLFAWWLAKRRCKRADSPINSEQVDDLVFYAMLGVIIGGRVGYAHGQFLPYITAGIATGYIDWRPGPITSGDFMFGFSGGGGLEFVLGDGWHGRAEYLYVDYGKEGSGAYRVDVEEMHLVRVGISKNVTPFIDAILGR